MNKFTYSAPIVAREALAILTSNTVLGGLVYREYANEFTSAKRGDTINIKKPAEFEVKDFTTETVTQNITEGSTNLQLTNHLDVTVAVTSKQWTLELENFREQVIVPAMTAFSEKIDTMVAQTALQFNQTAYLSGSPMTLGSLARVDRVLNDARVPMQNRYGVVSPITKEYMMGIDAVIRADARGDNGTALREASMGRVMNLDWYMDQNIQYHVAGDIASDDAAAMAAAVNEGATQATVTADAGFNVGDTFTVAGAEGSYVVTEASHSVTTATITFSPAAPAGGFKSAAKVSVTPSHYVNMAFTRNAIALATVPLETPEGAVQAAMESLDGIGIRVVYGYDLKTKTDTISFDVLVGTKVIDPRLGLRWAVPK